LGRSTSSRLIRPGWAVETLAAARAPPAPPTVSVAEASPCELDAADGSRVRAVLLSSESAVRASEAGAAVGAAATGCAPAEADVLDDDDAPVEAGRTVGTLAAGTDEPIVRGFCLLAVKSRHDWPIWSVDGEVADAAPPWLADGDDAVGAACGTGALTEEGGVGTDKTDSRRRELGRGGRTVVERSGCSVGGIVGGRGSG